MARKKSVGRPRSDEITSSQQRTLDEIKRYIARHNMPPTMRELAELMGVNSASAYDQVNQLVRKGRLKREARKSRSLSVVEINTPLDISELVAVPILGNVAAGQPIFAEENITGYANVEGSLVRKGRCFALHVVGDSMIKVGIRPKDLVIVRQQPVAENGDIVVALLDGDATVKRLSISDETIQLCPENPKYRAISIDADQDFRIVGKVIAIRRLQTT